MGDARATVVVTKHDALLDYLIEQGIVPAGTQRRDYVKPRDVAGKHVVGHIPYHLAQYARCVTSIIISIPSQRRGLRLTLDEIREYAQEPQTFRVIRDDGAREGGNATC